MGNLTQTFIKPDGTHLGPTCGLSWVEIGMNLPRNLVFFIVECSLADEIDAVPWGFRKILNWAYKRYGYPIYITENGMCCTDEASKSLPDVLDDKERIAYLIGYLNAMKEAIIQDGVDVRSYFAWTLADNWEWADGLSTRFGVSFTERDAEGRVVGYRPKKSAGEVTQWFQRNLAKES
jgi:beta-glucosidase